MHCTTVSDGNVTNAWSDIYTKWKEMSSNSSMSPAGSIAGAVYHKL